MGDGGENGEHSPASVIHSVDGTNSPPTPGTGAVTSPASKRPNGKTRQSSNALSVQNIRRIFSPTYDRKSNANPPSPLTNSSTNSNEESNAAVPASQASSAAAGSRKKNMFSFIRACFVPTVDEPVTLDPMNILRQIRDCEPAYEPESPLLPAAEPGLAQRTCLVLDLDETLVHSSFTPIPDPDFEIPLEMQGETHMVYVKKRPGVDEFLQKVCQWYEVIVFTASLALYANPVMDLLDPQGLVHGRLYREHCVFTAGCYVKDISKLGRDLSRIIIVDNSPLSYALQPENAVPITSFISDDGDRELEKTLAILQQARTLTDVRNVT